MPTTTTSRIWSALLAASTLAKPLCSGKVLMAHWLPHEEQVISHGLELQLLITAHCDSSWWVREKFTDWNKLNLQVFEGKQNTHTRLCRHHLHFVVYACYLWSPLLTLRCTAGTGLGLVRALCSGFQLNSVLQFHSCPGWPPICAGQHIKHFVFGHILQWNVMIYPHEGF